MDFKSVEALGENKVIIKEVKNFELPHIFDCGQCFRWDRTERDTYIGIAFGKIIEVEKKDDNVIIHNSSLDDFNNIWREYFDLDRDYSKIKDEFITDPLLKQAVEFGYGIRLLKQEPFEIVISFIISANNRIPMIKRAIKNISKKWGEELNYNGETFYSFPTVEKLKEVTLEEIESCGVGFRAKYIVDTVNRVYDSKMSSEGNLDFDLNNIKSKGDDECHKLLQNFMGIGPKVADCIMLFSMEKYSAFPVDVWVKRAMQHFYLAPDVSLKKIRDFGRDKFGPLSGFAQQYLFYYARENNISVGEE